MYTDATMETALAASPNFAICPVICFTLLCEQKISHLNICLKFEHFVRLSSPFGYANQDARWGATSSDLVTTPMCPPGTSTIRESGRAADAILQASNW
jgi:hypothetical protein